jgi:elongation factor G
MLRDKLMHNAHLVTYPIGAEDQFKGVVDLVTREAIYFDGENGENVRKEACPPELKEKVEEYRQHLVAALGDFDDNVAMKYLEEQEVTPADIYPALRKATMSLKFTPVFCGSAFKNKGVQHLLDGVVKYLPNPSEVENKALDQKNNEAVTILKSDPNAPFVGLAFKLEDGRFGQLTYMRIYQGKVSKGDFIININNGKRVKVPRIVRMHSSEMHDIDTAQAGDICALFGIECASGDTFTDGTVEMTMTSMHVPAAVISLAVSPKNREGQTNFSKALNRFGKEDPTFRVSRDEESGETLISGMGELHLEIYIERMKREYNCEVNVGKPQVAYRETFTKKARLDYTHKKQTGGSGQFAKIQGWLEPLPEDAVENYEFVDEVVGGVIPREFIPACDKGFREQLTKGQLIGMPVVRVRCTVDDGAYHAVDSSEMAFRVAAMAAIREAYNAAGPIILEPIMKVEVQAPEEIQGSVVGNLNQRRGIILDSSTDQGYVVVQANVPFSEMFGYSTALRSATQGKGEFTMEFAKYEPVPRNIQEEMCRMYQEKRKAEQK